MQKGIVFYQMTEPEAVIVPWPSGAGGWGGGGEGPDCCCVFTESIKVQLYFNQWLSLNLNQNR